MYKMNIYEKNKQYIVNNSVGIDFNKLDENIKKTEIIETEQGKTLIIKNNNSQKYVYSKYTPLETVEFQVNHMHGHQENTIIVFGSGLFYEIKSIAKEWTLPSKVIVVEPDEQTFLECVKHLDFEIETKNIEYKFYVNNGELNYKQFLHTVIEGNEGLRTKIYSSIAYRELYYSFYIEFMKSTSDKLRETEINIATSHVFAEKKIRNVAENIVYFNKGFNGSKLEGKFTGGTAVVVSAGPSLNKNVEQLKALQGKVLIIAAYTAIPTLEKFGIVPDFVVTVDPQQPLLQKHIKDKMDYNLIVDLSSNPAVIGNNLGNNYFIVTLSDEIFYKMFVTDNQSMTAYSGGGSVATVAFMLAAEAGVENVILIGQDLAFTDGKTHSYDNVYGGVELYRNRMRTKGYYGGYVETNTSWNSFRVWFEDMVAVLRKDGITARFINSTEGGAYIENFEHMPFSEALALAKPIDIQKIIDESTEDGRIKIENTRQIYSMLKHILETLKSIKDDSAKGFEAIDKIEKLYKHNPYPKVSQVNKQIAVLQELDKKIKKNRDELMFISELLEIEMVLTDMPLKVGENKDLKDIRDNKNFYEGINKSIDFVIPIVEEMIGNLEKEFDLE